MAAQDNNNHNTNSRGGSVIKSEGPEEWQYVKKGDTKMVNGKMWWWCLNHNSGKGMYVHHPPSDHDEWFTRKNTSSRYISPDKQE